MTTSTVSIGGFSFTPTVPRWTWSDGMYTLHGMAPGDVVPTRALFLSHVHPDDRDRVSQVLDGAAAAPHGCSYRLVDLSGQERQVTLAVAPTGPDAGTITVSGFVVDDSERTRDEISAAVNTQLQVALESHAAIDQAKGMLMLVYGIEADAAFEVLRWASQQRNIRLRVLADRLVRAVLSVGGMGPRARGAIDEIVVAAMEDVQLPHREPQLRPLDVELDHRDSFPVLHVRGHVDATSMGQLASSLGRLMNAAADVKRAIVDLREVDELGTVATFVVQAAQRRSASRGITMDVVGAAAEHSRVDAQPHRSSHGGHPPLVRQP